jgi:hypothetical protein
MIREKTHHREGLLDSSIFEGAIESLVLEPSLGLDAILYHLPNCRIYSAIVTAGLKLAWKAVHIFIYTSLSFP